MHDPARDKGPPALSATGSRPGNLLAAGSLARVFEDLPDPMRLGLTLHCGPSGLLRQAIEGGAAWDVFASADTGHAAALHHAGLAAVPRVFCHNSLCLILRPGLGPAAAETLLTRPDLTLGVSTPGADPSGDYAIAALARLEALSPGAGQAAQARARRLSGAPGMPLAPVGRNVYAWLLTSGAADLFLTYATNGRAAQADTPALGLVDLPESLQVRAAYALTTRPGVGPDAMALVDWIFAPEGQSRLRALGFLPLLPPSLTGASV